MRIYQKELSTPLGKMLALSSLNGLFLLTFQDEKPFLTSFLPKISLYYQNTSLSKGQNEILIKTTRWLENYFEAPKLETSMPALEFIGPDFSKAVWKALVSLQKTELHTYGFIAQSIQKPKAVRAVGRSIGENPIALLAPCHRIIGANGKLTGYRGGLWRKGWLLKHEQLI